MEIELKNIGIEKVTVMQQVDKAQEEEQEFWEAYSDGEDRNHIIEEFYDCMQSKLGLLYKAGITAEEVMQAYPKHLEKIKNRPRKK